MRPEVIWEGPIDFYLGSDYQKRTVRVVSTYEVEPEGKIPWVKDEDVVVETKYVDALGKGSWYRVPEDDVSGALRAVVVLMHLHLAKGIKRP